jgi:hypothetical protein
MGDNETNHDDVDNAGDTEVDEIAEDATEDESDTSENTDDEDAEESDDDSADDGSDDDGKGNSDSESDTAEEDAAEDDDSEPELRKPQKGASNAEWAAWRAQEKAKAKAKQEAQKSGTDDTDDDAEDSDDDDMSPEDAAAIDKRIEKAIAPFKKQAAEQEVDTEIATFLNANPDFKPYAAKVRRWALHPNRQNVPVKSIFYEVAGDKLMALGAKRAKAADVKAQKTKSVGGRTGGEQGNKSFKDMPLNDFEKELNAAKLGR